MRPGLLIAQRSAAPILIPVGMRIVVVRGAAPVAEVLIGFVVIACKGSACAVTGTLEVVPGPLGTLEGVERLENPPLKLVVFAF